MPTYTYRFEDGSTVEVDQDIREDSLTEIDGRTVRKVYSAPGIVLKGSGFFRTGGR